HRGRRFLAHRWIHFAALLLITLSIATIIYHLSQQSSPKGYDTKGDILLPEGQQAILTLADGRSIVVDDSSDGLLAQETGVQIKKDSDGSVLYSVLPQSETPETAGQYNTFSTPKGHSYKLVLPDGTK